MSAGAAVEQYQFKVPFIIYRDLKSILKPVDEQYMEKMNQMTIEQKGKTPYTEKISTHEPLHVSTQYLCLWRCSGSIGNVPG